jgi:hypothetical protein
MYPFILYTFLISLESLLTPYPVSPKGEMIFFYSFPRGGRLGRGRYNIIIDLL